MELYEINFCNGKKSFDIKLFEKNQNWFGFFCPRWFIIQPFKIFTCLKKCVKLSRYGTMYYEVSFM